MILAAVGPAMTEVAGEVADGMIIHPFSNVPYIESVTLPAIERGWPRPGASRRLRDFLLELCGDRARRSGIRGIEEGRQRSGSLSMAPRRPTKACSMPLASGELQGELNAMSKQGRWQEMGELITDDINHAFGVMAEPGDVAPEMLKRYASFTDRTSASFPVSDASERDAIISALRAG